MILAACKILHSSFAEVEAMDVETLMDLLDVWEKMTDTGGGKGKATPMVFIDEIL